MQNPSESNPDSQRLVVTCVVQGTRCGVDAQSVQEVVRVAHITPVHQAPDFVLGVMNLRGRILTVIDLAVKLNLGRTSMTADSRILIVEFQGEPVGLLIERDSGVAEVAPPDMRPAPENLRRMYGAVLDGVCLINDQLIAILNLDALLGDDRGV
jgi:purine-binding chemotaxis protein CheW